MNPNELTEAANTDKTIQRLHDRIESLNKLLLKQDELIVELRAGPPPPKDTTLQRLNGTIARLEKQIIDVTERWQQSGSNYIRALETIKLRNARIKELEAEVDTLYERISG